MASFSNSGALLAIGAASLLAAGGAMRSRRNGNRATDYLTARTAIIEAPVFDEVAALDVARMRSDMTRRMTGDAEAVESMRKSHAARAEIMARARAVGGWGSRSTQLSRDNGLLCEALSGLLAVLRAMHISIHEGHWTVSGSNFYSDHLLLERVYAGAGGGPVLQDDIDGLGERIVAYCGPGFVDSRVVTKKALGLIDAWHDAAPSPVARALHAEESLQVALRAVYDALRASGPVPLGLDDFLMAMADAHDTNRYLLQQRVSSQDRS